LALSDWLARQQTNLRAKKATIRRPTVSYPSASELNLELYTILINPEKLIATSGWNIRIGP